MIDNKYLVLSGNEYGIDITDNIDLTFITKDEAESKYINYLEEYGCAVMFLIEESKMVLIKSDNIF